MRKKAAPTAPDGRFELYKTSLKYDNPEARLAHGETMETTLVSIDSATFEDARLNGATAQVTVFSHLRKSTFRLINWGRASGKAQLVQGEDSLDSELDEPLPANVKDLDLVTLGGSINMGDSDGWAKLRTNGGSITVGRIKGKAAIITQGGFIKAGDIGDSAELRSSKR